MVVEVTGHQWRWEVTHPERGVRATNELHIPVGRTINVQLTSANVIYSFWVPGSAGRLTRCPTA
jgi:cytochrome c oxidase subunit 2